MIEPKAISQLRAYLEERLTGPAQIQMEATGEISRGWESVIDGIDIRRSGKADRFVLRRYEGERGAAKSTLELMALEELAAAGYPVPTPLLAESDVAVIGSPFLIMARVEGEELWSVLDRAFRPELLAKFTELLADLHDIPLPARQAIPMDSGSGQALTAEVARWRTLVSRYATPGFDRVLSWLENEAPGSPVDPTLVHWDYHPANVLLGPDDSMTVIDWTQYGVSDPRLDLAWTLLLVDSSGRPDWAETILGIYENRRGRQTDLELFRIAAAVKRLFAITISLTEGPQALGMRADATTDIRDHATALSRVYEALLRGCGIEIPEVEVLLGTP